jgi:menaquinone-dependent protoporphyrinogen oxidase
MDGTALVAFATKHGSTAGIAEAVAEPLRQAGLKVDVSPAAQVSALDRYGAVIVGSAVYMNRWQKEGTDFRPGVC